MDFDPQTLGEHIKKRRLQLQLTQKQASEQLGIQFWTLLNWEKSRTTPPFTSFPVIHQFLGYDPYPPSPTSIGEHLLAKRRQEGWTIRDCANVLEVDPSTLSDWEEGCTILYRKHRLKVAQLLGLSLQEIEVEMSKRWGVAHVQKRRK